MKQALIVLGMHRSGTSSVAGALSKLGATAPRTLMPEHPDNPKGYWESLPIVRANDQILASAGSSWNDWRPFNPNWIMSAAGQAHAASLPDLIREEFNDAPLIVLKDPRLCRLFPLWSQALKSAGYASVVLVPLRSPVEVAASLERRDGFSEARGLMIWLRHVLDAEYASRNTARHFLRWTDFIADWRSEIAKISQGLDVTFPNTSDFAESSVDQFLDVKLKRVATPSKWPAHIQPWMRETWDALGTLTSAPQDSEALKKLDAIREEFDQSSKIFGPVLVGMETEKYLWATEHKEEIERIKIQLADTANERDQNLISRINTEALIPQYIEKIETLEVSNSEKLSENLELSNTLINAQKELLEMKDSIKDMEHQIENQKFEHERLKQELRFNEGEIDNIKIENQALLERHESLVAENYSSNLTLEDNAKKMHDLEVDLINARTQIASLNDALNEAKNEATRELESHQEKSIALSNQHDEIQKTLAEKTAALSELALEIAEMRAAETLRTARNPFRRFLS